VQKKALYAIIALLIWVVLIIMVMVVSYQINLEIFFVLWLIALLVVIELVSNSTVQPQNIRYLKYFVAVQVIIFGMIVAKKVLEILAK
jgi:hypothetical protein